MAEQYAVGAEKTSVRLCQEQSGKALGRADKFPVPGPSGLAQRNTVPKSMSDRRGVRQTWAESLLGYMLVCEFEQISYSL